MDHLDVVQHAFVDELTKISGELHGHVRSVRRPISVERLLERESEDKRKPSQVLKKKLSAVNLSGLSPETVAQMVDPPPTFETPGMSRALEILDRAKLMKTASKKDPKSVQAVKSVGGHTLTGLGVGTAAGNVAHGVGVHWLKNRGLTEKQRFNLAMLGAALGVAEYGRKRVAERSEKKAGVTNITSPALALKSRQQVGTIKTDLNSGPSVEHQIRNRKI